MKKFAWAAALVLTLAVVADADARGCRGGGRHGGGCGWVSSGCYYVVPCCDSNGNGNGNGVVAPETTAVPPTNGDGKAPANGDGKAPANGDVPATPPAPGNGDAPTPPPPPKEPLGRIIEMGNGTAYYMAGLYRLPNGRLAHYDAGYYQSPTRPLMPARFAPQR